MPVDSGLLGFAALGHRIHRAAKPIERNVGIYGVRYMGSSIDLWWLIPLAVAVGAALGWLFAPARLMAAMIAQGADEEPALLRSEERRVGHEGVNQCRSRSWPYKSTKKIKTKRTE